MLLQGIVKVVFVKQYRRQAPWGLAPVRHTRKPSVVFQLSQQLKARRFRHQANEQIVG